MAGRQVAAECGSSRHLAPDRVRKLGSILPGNIQQTFQRTDHHRAEGGSPVPILKNPETSDVTITLDQP